MAKLKGKIFKVGGSFAFLVNKALVDAEVIKENVFYEFEPKALDELFKLPTPNPLLQLSQLFKDFHQKSLQKSAVTA